jgi:hypothetical protein
LSIACTSSGEIDGKPSNSGCTSGRGGTTVLMD